MNSVPLADPLAALPGLESLNRAALHALPHALGLLAVLSAALLVVLALRPLLRAGTGAQVTYAAWGLVPLAIAMYALSAALGLALPGWPWPRAALALSPLLAFSPGAAVVATRAAVAPSAWAGALALIWLAGAAACALWLVWQQRRFVAGLGPLVAYVPGVEQGDSLQRGSVQGAGHDTARSRIRNGPGVTALGFALRDTDGRYRILTGPGVTAPCAMGLLHPAVVLPADFAQRYTAQEQQLITAHELVHLRRGDLWANALAALAQVLFWFHPLVWWAAHRLRLDQELACDAAVLAPHQARADAVARGATQATAGSAAQADALGATAQADAPKPAAQAHTASPTQSLGPAGSANVAAAYARAILKTVQGAQRTSTGATFICHWQFRHPLKDRIMKLNAPRPRQAVRIAAQSALAAVALAACYGAAATAQSQSQSQSPGSPAVKAGQYRIEVAYQRRSIDPAAAVSTYRTNFSVVADAGKAATVKLGEAGKTACEFSFTATPQVDAVDTTQPKVMLDVPFTCGGISPKPKMVTELGKMASLEFAQGEPATGQLIHSLTLLVTR